MRQLGNLVFDTGQRSRRDPDFIDDPTVVGGNGHQLFRHE